MRAFEVRVNKKVLLILSLMHSHLLDHVLNELIGLLQIFRLFAF